MRTTGVDVSVFELGGVNFLGDLKSAEIRSDVDFADGTAIIQTGVRPVVTRRSAEVSAEILSGGGESGRVTGLDLSSVTLDGVQSLGNVGRLQFSGSVLHEEGAGASEVWQYPVAVRKDYRCRLELLAETGGPFEILRSYDSLANLSVDFSFVLNGVTVALPMVLRSGRHVMADGSVQKWILELSGQAPIGSPYPVAPVGTGSLLGAAMNAPGTALSLVAESRAADGIGYSGAFIVKEFGFGVREGAVVASRYRYVSQGPVVAGVTV